MSTPFVLVSRKATNFSFCLPTLPKRSASNPNARGVEQERARFLAVGFDLQVITSINGYFQWVSPTFERLLGWTLDEMTSRPWTDFVHPDDIPESVSEADNLFSGHETFAFENRYRHKDGSYRWFLWKAQSYPAEEVIYGAAVDITDRVRVEDECKQAEATQRKSEARLRLQFDTTLSTITDQVFNFDRDGWVVYANQVLLNLWRPPQKTCSAKRWLNSIILMRSSGK